MLKLKSLSPLFAPLALASVITAGDVAVHSFVPQLQNSAIAAPEMTAQQKIEMISKNKGQIGSGDQLRRFFFGDLLPLGVQPGGAGMVVNLYNKANDVTFSYCATYDVVVAVKQGKVAMFSPNEVK
ncbi:MAG: hypothetical protein P2A85_13460 [Microcoleus anatoxicus]|uniref:Uncharacterized protein n=1 Tax=Microcoleus anatoxicus PTRS2 TaxID=2705321 RepID=A0ABU8YHR8_9CYAN|nr:MAG: hypothetical protein EA000_11845 [Oscillatoriales cyanobacterium]TAD98049.1 MAG: hypothetical protein EAZ98_07890 [Oscillatoriales cyanobacterium]TAE06322.1 MAG: hypothetical protein EAZ96_02680 [Oscillatoriales cyanobacterium]TAF05147.1 MAG: hypothetical protein EAZ78_06545 [Oscillatoriales cyanobacterium]TAF47092.1 MAG: hypothetical protein EAZ68_02620 [Oscillatoriales cyanobacterium]